MKKAPYGSFLRETSSENYFFAFFAVFFFAVFLAAFFFAMVICKSSVMLIRPMLASRKRYSHVFLCIITDICTCKSFFSEKCG